MKLVNIDNYQIVYRLHASKRMFERQIDNNDVEQILRNGKIIERYDDDYPLPSLLINGLTKNQRPIHLVAAINEHEKRLIIVTVYEPNSTKWLDNFSRRKL